MRTPVNALLPVVGFCGRLPASNLRPGFPLSEQAAERQEQSAEPKIWEPDAYKVAVLLLAAAAILSAL
jgi:hypothetical protein